ncbi:hypothetical protein LCGC14_2441960 [marine sediment metagenome]|uniref:Holliday junction resolvase n=1 Tax=marine sediment metagenome TaxID=412755 RepID=A0A0F9BIP9_9ZZZZ
MSRSKKKGTGFETEMVKLLQKIGCKARRQPGSGAIQDFPCDIQIGDPVTGRMFCENKIRADGFKRLYKWLSGADILFIRADRKEPLVVIPFSKIPGFVDILGRD